MKEMIQYHIGDTFKSIKFGWIYRVESIKDGVVTLQDIIKKDVRVKFTLRALEERVQKNSFAYIPQLM